MRPGQKGSELWEHFHWYKKTWLSYTIFIGIRKAVNKPNLEKGNAIFNVWRALFLKGASQNDLEGVSLKRILCKAKFFLPFMVHVCVCISSTGAPVLTMSPQNNWRVDKYLQGFFSHLVSWLSFYAWISSLPSPPLLWEDWLEQTELGGD